MQRQVAEEVGSRTAGEVRLAELVASMYGSDYAIWEPKWQIEGFLNWNYPDAVACSDYPAVTDATSARSFDSTPRSCTASRCLGNSSYQPRRARRRQGRTRSSSSRDEQPGTVLAALDGVINPELDEPITSLRSSVRLTSPPTAMSRCCSWLPTPQCAPNFAFLMAADACVAVRRLPGVRTVTVKLQDHYTGDEINRALTLGDGFSGASPGETEDDDLSAFGELFQRKTLIARQSKLCEALRARAQTRSSGCAPRPRTLASPQIRPVRRRSCRRTRSRSQPEPCSAGCGWPGRTTSTSRRASGRRSLEWSCRTHPATRTRGGCMSSVRL
jgi:hypothetical protein